MYTLLKHVAQGYTHGEHDILSLETGCTADVYPDEHDRQFIGELQAEHPFGQAEHDRLVFKKYPLLHTLHKFILEREHLTQFETGHGMHVALDGNRLNPKGQVLQPLWQLSMGRHEELLGLNE